MKTKHIALAVAVALGTSAAYAGDTSSSMRGKIYDPKGDGAANTKITIIHQPSGTTREVMTNDTGAFVASGLRVGGPYQVIIDSDTYTDAVVENVYLQLGEAYRLERQLEDSNVERIQVTATRTALNLDQSSPATVFGLEDIESSVAVDRDIKSIVEQDPRVTIDASNSNAIQCAGGSNRSNSLTVDGIRMNDNFGLNNNGYPTERLPFPYDAISQVKVDLAPFDVTYGGFSGCSINAVTKSGENEIHGKVFVDYTSDSLKGDKIEKRSLQNPAYSEKRYGFTFGAPLIEDQLFAFVAYEKHNPSTIFLYGPEDAGFTSPIEGVTTELVNEIAQVAKDKYGYTVNPLATKGDNEEEKVLAKIDWTINSDHRAFFTYQNTKGNTTSSTDSSSTRFAFNDHFYLKSNDLTSYALQAFSDWTEDFSTDIRVAYQEVDNGQNPLTSDMNFGHFQINDVDGNKTRVYFGPDQYRHANKLKYDTLSTRISGTYLLNEHEIMGGFETETTDIFNMFVDASQGVFQFNNLADFKAGKASSIFYKNAPSHNAADGAAEFSLDTATVYVQDKWTATDDLQVTFGLRFDKWSSDTLPTANAKFEERYGFTNAQKLSVSLLQPRVGFNYRLTDETVVYGGLGLFSGGNPNVWFSNTFSNNGVAVLASSLSSRNASAEVLAALDASNTPNFGFEVPDLMKTEAYFKGGDGEVNALDPNFKAPGIWKLNLGVQSEVAEGLVMGGDIILSKEKNPAIVQDMRLSVKSELFDGRPVYQSNGHSNPDILLTNSNESATSKVLSMFADYKVNAKWSLKAGYSYQDVEETHPMTSSTATSNYKYLMTMDPKNPTPSTSNYETPHRFTLNLGYKTELFSGYATRFNLFAQRVKGRGFSYTFDNDPGYGDLVGGGNDRNLLYVPTENDANVIYGAGFDQAAFNQFLADSGLDKYRGQVAPRNGFNSDWWSRVDVKITQELPVFAEGHKAKFYVSMNNVGNFIDPHWGVRKQVGFPYNNTVVDATVVNGKYQFNKFLTPRENEALDSSSTWSVLLGVEYNF